MTQAVPRPEHPRPTCARPSWLNLNGRWEFEIDQADSGLERGLRDRPLTGAITVPFAPESEASGVHVTDFLEAVWYARTVDVPAEWAGSRVLLHFGAVDHDATVWVDGAEVARHRGGFSPFSADLGDRAGQTVRIVVRARDTHHGPQARGKQATTYANHTCVYTRTTGIWQTVWLEAVPQVHVRRLRVTPNLAAGTLTVEAPVTANRPGHRLVVELSDDEGPVARAEARADLDLTPSVQLTVPPQRLRPWSPEDPHLYDLRVALVDSTGDPVDEITSYAGIRSVAIDGRALHLNGRPVFQRLVLDQGYWPETLMTAPSDDALVRDIELAMAAGFNGARLHQKVFEERFLYHADRLGYLVWGEFGDWGARAGDEQQPTASFVTQWLEVLQRDHNHPAIVGWCPLNETWEVLHDRITVLDDVTRAMFLATKLADPTRPVLDASGYSHRVPETDVWDSHNYEQDPGRFAEQVGGLADGRPHVNLHDGRQISLPYTGQPYFVSEFGGIWWDPDAADADGEDRDVSWGYGTRVRDEAGFHERFAGLTGALLSDPEMFGYCYTQLTDLMQERNGIYRFDRSTKLDVELVRKAQLRPAAYESRKRGTTDGGDRTTMTRIHPSNSDAATAWDGRTGEFWADNADLFDAGVARYLQPFLAAADIEPTAHVLDVGCGNGLTTREVARRAASATGADLSARMLDLARRRAAADGLTNVTFLQADVQVADLGESRYDRVISRNGVMFFGDPVAAFANLARALKPDGRLVLLVWQAMSENPWLTAFRRAVGAPLPPPDGPGPFALGDPDRVRTLLTEAGFAEPVLTGVREPMYYGPDVDSAERYVRAMNGGLLDELDDVARAEAEAALRATLEEHLGPDGVTYPSAMWIVTAHR